MAQPLEFTLLLGDRIDHVRGDKSKITSNNPDPGDPLAHMFTGYPCTAVCANPSDVMSSGKHYATFTLTGAQRLFYSYIGVVRPTSELKFLDYGDFAFWNEHNFEQLHDVVTVKDEDARPFVGAGWKASEVTSNVDYCSLYTLEGDCKYADFRSYLFDDASRLVNETEEGRLEGTIRDRSMDAEFGMLLDLDEGALTVYKNGKKLGLLKDGLRGEYVWTATIMAQYKGTGDEQNVRIQRAPVPTS